ncbi:RNA methyltransferase [Thermincola potens]|uniref:tRNA (guanine-N(1)-)-methyltransferase C-terminal domain-containing protein n=1 Tax=Thermincola potens (strain JR) TaxID=635013 RepID=D5X8L4_THEPJ|nr:RNA methyltransferase [Thermincola potens]ADG82890.1 Protein of unknown function DUF2168 [Thermincola potens JR]
MSSAPKLYIGLLHYPVYNKNMNVITTSITNLDIHDIARTACTYDIARYYVIHPLDTQRRLIGDILNYWQEGYGASYNPDRKEAFQRVKLIDTLDSAMQEIEKVEGQVPKLITTDARIYPNTISYKEMRKLLDTGDPYLLLFGTGWGIEKETMLKSDYILEPIYGAGPYNHLSVRSAVAIILDRLKGTPWWE